MNMGAHIAVAAGLHHRRVGSGGEPADPGELLGSALPDLAAMGRFRLLGSAGDAGVRSGIQLHYRTDDVFHRHPWFHRRQQSLMDDLTGLGFGRGPAMACAHVGIELLIDGVLLTARPVAIGTQTAFDAIPRLRPALAALVPATHEDRWLEHLDRFAGRPPLRDLDDPPSVGERLHRILAGRPRLAFDRRQLPELIGALARQRPEVAATSVELVTDLIDDLAEGGSGGGFDSPWAFSGADA